MSYIPDYRQETGKLNEKDRSYIEGYRQAVEDVLCFLDDAEELSLGEGALEEVREQIAVQMELEEIDKELGGDDDMADELEDEEEVEED